ncbi:tetratricopeptide repeat protein [Oscillatoriales cyanobacterium LEGE 11467]|uniref:Tetratricopeptide repeat protein n=1 Tax=Zarconia navalis LEGE 11467 TaxID=1828826 RepID=A0A928VTD4_9CYAN|nr:tetratricopeptide repeat protein [Zarconia navalis]MBE9039912.1 tetratricopeptide repeat protein [Zarconia navalis LEGE 11467]
MEMQLVKQQKYDRILSFIESLAGLQPQNYLAWYAQGDTLRELERYREAVYCYQKAVSIEPGTQGGWPGRIKRLQKLQQHQAALIFCKKIAQTLSRQQSQADLDRPHIWYRFHRGWSELGNCFGIVRHYPGAIAAYDEALKLDNRDRAIWLARAKALELWKRYAEAVRDYERVLDLAPNDREAILGKNRVLQYLETQKK